jgi:HSP20 family protein
MPKKKPSLWFEDKSEDPEDSFESTDTFSNPLGSLLKFPDFKVNLIPVKIGETEDKLLLRAEVPGFSKQDIRVKVTPNLVYLSAQKKSKNVNKGNDFFSSSISSSSTSRILQLPKQVKTDGVRARYKDGFLEVVMQKKEKDVNAE